MLTAIWELHEFVVTAIAALNLSDLRADRLHYKILRSNIRNY